MRQDANTTIQLISKSVEQVLASDGWIGKERVYSRFALNKIADGMVRKVEEPGRYVTQGYHLTSVQQCLLRRLIEEDPTYVLDLIASLVTTGEAKVKTSTGLVNVAIEMKSLQLDLEARLANDELVVQKGVRDGCGQLWDLLFTQGFWDAKSTRSVRYIYTQEPNIRAGTTGERLIKAEIAADTQFDVVYQGPYLTLRHVCEFHEYFEGGTQNLLVHESLCESLSVDPITKADDLKERLLAHQARLRGPATAIVFAGALPGASQPSSGQDLHAVTVTVNSDGDMFFLESRWGVTSDIHLNGITAEEFLRAMRLPERLGVLEPYDEDPPHQRVVDPANPIRKLDRAPQFSQLELISKRLAELDEQAKTNPRKLKQDKYYMDLEKWETKRAEHFSVFGESIPFTIPRPRPPL